MHVGTSGKPTWRSPYAIERMCVKLSIASRSLWTSPFDKRRRFAFGPRKFLSLDFAGRINGEHTFPVNHENSIRIAALTRTFDGPALAQAPTQRCTRLAAQSASRATLRCLG